MQSLDRTTLVRSPDGEVEPRLVTPVEEWRVESEVHADGLVLSVIDRDGVARSFLVARDDARDLGGVLRNRAAGSRAAR